MQKTFRKVRTPAYTVRRASEFGKKIIKSFIKGDRAYQLHATKGWRSYKV